MTAEVRSIVAADLELLAEARLLGRALSLLAQTWTNLVSFAPLADPAPPTAPAQPLTRVTVSVPPAMLGVRELAPSSVDGSARASGDRLMLTFQHDDLTSELPIEFDVTCTQPDRPVLTDSASATLTAGATLEILCMNYCACESDSSRACVDGCVAALSDPQDLETLRGECLDCVANLSCAQLTDDNQWGVACPACGTTE